MARHFINLFSPETWAAFRQTDANVSGFRERQLNAAACPNQGDLFVCYLTRLSRWCGVLRVASEVYRDASPIFSDPDPFVCRFRVETLVALDPTQAVPVWTDELWTQLSFTKPHPKGSSAWTGVVRSSLHELKPADGELLVERLVAQGTNPSPFSLTERDQRRLVRKGVIPTPLGEVLVEVPAEEEEEEEADPTATPPLRNKGAQPPAPEPDARRSTEVQAQVAIIGAVMGFRVWVPQGDRARILALVPPKHRAAFLDSLNLNYEATTLETVRQIDVLWLNGNAMTRAFEIEHTTAVYSGLLRMADLFALQPNMKIKAHIVAPDERREKVLKEIRPPVFPMLASGPLYESCTFLSYDDIKAVETLPHLDDTRHTILDKYAVSAAEEG